MGHHSAFGDILLKIEWYIINTLECESAMHGPFIDSTIYRNSLAFSHLFSICILYLVYPEIRTNVTTPKTEKKKLWPTQASERRSRNRKKWTSEKSTHIVVSKSKQKPTNKTLCICLSASAICSNMLLYQAYYSSTSSCSFIFFCLIHSGCGAVLFALSHRFHFNMYYKLVHVYQIVCIYIHWYTHI